MSIREAAQDVLEEIDKMRQGTYDPLVGVSPANREALRTALAEPQGEPDAAGLLHDKAHTDTGKTRAAQSVRTPEMSYRPGSLPMEDKPVAWGMLSKGVIVDAICPAEHDEEEGDYTVPLYTHPQPSKGEPVACLAKVLEWIDNWEPEFANDPDWFADRDAARAIIDAARNV